MCVGILFASTKVVQRPRSHSPLNFGIRHIWQICTPKWYASARRLSSAALLEVCRVKITFTLQPTNHFVSTTTNWMKCLVNWIPLRSRVRSRNTQLHLKLDICQLKKERKKENPRVFNWNSTFKERNPGILTTAMNLVHSSKYSFRKLSNFYNILLSLANFRRGPISKCM